MALEHGKPPYTADQDPHTARAKAARRSPFAGGEPTTATPGDAKAAQADYSQAGAQPHPDQPGWVRPAEVAALVATGVTAVGVEASRDWRDVRGLVSSIFDRHDGTTTSQNNGKATPPAGGQSTKTPETGTPTPTLENQDVSQQKFSDFLLEAQVIGGVKMNVEQVSGTTYVMDAQGKVTVEPGTYYQFTAEVNGKQEVVATAGQYQQLVRGKVINEMSFGDPQHRGSTVDIEGQVLATKLLLHQQGIDAQKGNVMDVMNPIALPSGATVTVDYINYPATGQHQIKYTVTYPNGTSGDIIDIFKQGDQVRYLGQGDGTTFMKDDSISSKDPRWSIYYFNSSTGDTVADTQFQEGHALVKGNTSTEVLVSAINSQPFEITTGAGTYIVQLR